MPPALRAWLAAALRGALAAQSIPLDDAVLEAVADAADAAAAEVATALRSLARAPVDEQATTPLEIVRAAVQSAGAVLAGAGARPVARDDFVTARFPADAYGLVPASLAALDPSLAEPALRWGAAKAMAHRARHGG